MPRPQRTSPTQALLAFYGFGSQSPSTSTACDSAATTGQTPRNTKLIVNISDRPPASQHTSKLDQPISLLPSRLDAYGLDTGAFIVDKLVTPLDGEATAADNYGSAEKDAWYAANPQQRTVRRMLCYVVGWPNEPYARQLVRCTEILDYVSPRTLEDWEYAQMEERRALMTARKESPTGRRDDDFSANRELGRSSKAAMAKKADATGTAIAPEVAGQDSAGTPSISSAPSRVPSSPVQGLPRQPLSSSTMHSSLSNLQIRPSSPPSSGRASLLPSSITLPVSLSSPSTNKAKTGPSLKRPFQHFAEDQQGPDVSTIAKGTDGVEAFEAKLPVKNQNEEGIEDGEDEDELQRESVHPAHSMLAQPLQTASLVHRRPIQEAPRFALSPTPYKRARSTGCATDLTANRPASSEGPFAIPLQQSGQNCPTNARHYMPLRQDEAISKTDLNFVETVAPTSSLFLPRRKTTHVSMLSPSPSALSRTSREELQEEAQELKGDRNEVFYEVDRLVNDCLAAVDEKGNVDFRELTAKADSKKVASIGSRLVHFFLVRWKGDWPPDQNPTWEPAENLPPRMIRQYLKKAARKRADTNEIREART